MIKINCELSIPVVANKRYADISYREHQKYDGWRTIGGDRADLRFKGFHIEDDKTVLDSPELERAELEDFDDDAERAVERAEDYAIDILMASFASIGTDCVER